MINDERNNGGEIGVRKEEEKEERTDRDECCVAKNILGWEVGKGRNRG